MEEQPKTESPAETPVKTSNDKKRRFPAKNALVIMVLMALAFGGGYFWRDHAAKADKKDHVAEVASLKKDVAELKKASKSASKTNESDAATKPSAEAIENIKASITSGNTAALEGYMASTVKVILAASEGIGDRTPAQAISDLAYLDSGTDPWDFSLPAATLSNWQSGSYASYFPADAVVGKSANDYFISFTFNSAGKISGIFMGMDASSLGS